MAKLGEVCIQITDGSHNPPSGAEQSEYLMLSSKNIDDDFITLDSPRFLSHSDYIAENKRTTVSEGDLLMTIVGTIGRVAIVPEELKGICLQRSVAVIKPKREVVNNRYLMYQLQNMRPFLEKEARGVAQKGIYLKQVSQLDIKLPELEHQMQIVKVLDKASKLIFLRRQQLAKLDELVKARFVEMFGDPVRNEKGWNTYALAEMCDGIGDGLHGTPEYDENGEYPFINGNNLIDGVIQINASTKKVNKKTYEKHYIKISQNAILLSINGTLGKIAFYNGEQVMLGKSACYCNLKDEVNRIFVYKIMKTDAFAGYLEDNSTKSTIKNVGLKAIREYRLIAPPLSLQNQFAVFAEYVDQQKQTVQQSLEKLELLKKALMQEYFR